MHFSRIIALTNLSLLISLSSAHSAWSSSNPKEEHTTALSRRAFDQWLDPSAFPRKTDRKGAWTFRHFTSSDRKTVVYLDGAGPSVEAKALELLSQTFAQVVTTKIDFNGAGQEHWFPLDMTGTIGEGKLARDLMITFWYDCTKRWDRFIEPWEQAADYVKGAPAGSRSKRVSLAQAGRQIIQRFGVLSGQFYYWDEIDGLVEASLTWEVRYAESVREDLDVDELLGKKRKVDGLIKGEGGELIELSREDAEELGLRVGPLEGEVEGLDGVAEEYIDRILSADQPDESRKRPRLSPKHD
ncbi:MAG: hypothetical protein M1831_000162 [Alyxoria varia]|nr:MAG: hypothetical protein M1831_000162 [Alyxoria varia]